MTEVRTTLTSQETGVEQVMQVDGKKKQANAREAGVDKAEKQIVFMYAAEAQRLG